MASRHIDEIIRICRHVDNDDITYKLMYKNFDQAVLRETLLFKGSYSPESKRSNNNDLTM